MTRIKIKDLPKDQEISQKELRQVLGGTVRGLRVQLLQTRSKTTTGSSFSDVINQGLSKTADTTMTAGQLAAPYIPGGSVLTSAVSG